MPPHRKIWMTDLALILPGAAARGFSISNFESPAALRRFVPRPVGRLISAYNRKRFRCGLPASAAVEPGRDSTFDVYDSLVPMPGNQGDARRIWQPEVSRGRRTGTQAAAVVGCSHR